MRAPRGAACESPNATVISWFKCPTVSERPNGSESKSDWHSSWHHARLDVEVVCRIQDVRLEHPHRFLGAEVSEQEACRCLGEPHSYRARCAPGQHHHPYGASGNRDRQEGRGHRKAPHGGGQDPRHDDERRAAQHRRNSQARTRRQTPPPRHPPPPPKPPPLPPLPQP